MKWLVLSLLLALPAHAEQLWIFGDSLSSPADGWPSILRNQYGYDVRLDAVPGRKVAYYAFPLDLPVLGQQKAILLLGTNDAADPEAMKWYEQRMDILLATMRIKGFHVTLLIPPDFGLRSHPMKPVRDHQAHYCELAARLDIAARCIDLDRIWDRVPTLPDGIHPSPPGHQVIADFVARAL